ncbi:trehalose-phosphatase [Erythrobacter sp. NE805]|uniref:trehalose-phosphatase n=1 Tax=Erythrobacter sp. NE805 TaxID=3389875 RepID=UPI00396B0889
MTAADPPLALLLDFDGTLVPTARTPDAVVVTDRLRALMVEAMARLEGRLAMISGRSLDQLDAIWGRCVWPLTVAASYGMELRHDGRRHAPPPQDIFAQLIHDTQARFPPASGVVIELKSFGLGLHYRLAPGQEEALRVWAEARAAEHNLVVQPGDMVYELRLPGADKGDAVRAVMRLSPFAGSRPVYIGDDLADIPAIAAARSFGGSGIAVGERIAGHADTVLASPAAVLARIRELIAAVPQRS